jgi:hypothetical protein
MANDNLETVNARLRDELASLRRQQDQPPQGGPNPLVVHRENAAAEAYQTAGSQMQQLEKQHAELMAEGNFEKAAGLQRQITAVALQQEQARQQYVAVNGLRSINPVEQYLVLNKGQYSVEEENWIRQHPDYVRDPQFQRQIIESHDEALRDGYRRGSPGYYVRLDRAADRLRGDDAQLNAPPLTGDRLDLARSCFTTANPDADGRNDAEVSRWWSRQSRSEAAHRLREKWLDYGG